MSLRFCGEESRFCQSVVQPHENVGRDRWFWMIPLTPTKMSIGIVLDIVEFPGDEKGARATARSGGAWSYSILLCFYSALLPCFARSAANGALRCGKLTALPLVNRKELERRSQRQDRQGGRVDVPVDPIAAGRLNGPFAGGLLAA